MNVVLGMALLLLIAVFSIITSKEKGNRRKKGARWIHRWSRKKGWELPEWLTDECIWQTELAALAAGMLLVVTGMVGHAENMQAVSELRRPAYGQGVQEENLQVEWKDEQGKRQKEEMTVQVTEKQFSESEIEEIFSGLRDRIENEMLGENDSLDHVDHPLHLCEELPDCPVTIRWFSSRPEIMDWEGTYGEMIGEEGEEVILTATAQLQGKEWQESWNVLVFPRVPGKKNRWKIWWKRQMQIRQEARNGAASGSITRRKIDLETGRRRDAVRSGFACACISGNGTSAQTAERKGTEKEGTAADAAGLSGDCDKIAAVVKYRDESSKVGGADCE